MIKSNSKNPYLNHEDPYRRRTLPVGQFDYKPSNGKIELLSRWASLEYGEAEFIYDCPSKVGGGTLLNLGDDRGGSAVLLAQGLRDYGLEGHVWTVDLYDEVRANSSRAYMDSCGPKGISRKITLFRGATDAFVEIVKDKIKSVNFVFIDACHQYEFVKNDWMNYNPLVKPGGIIAFHDTNQNEIDKVLNESVKGNPDWEFIYWVNRIKAFRKIR